MSSKMIGIVYALLGVVTVGRVLAMTAIQSSTSHGGEADHAIENNSLRCAETLPELSPWWAVKLDKLTEIRTIIIKNRRSLAHVYS